MRKFVLVFCISCFIVACGGGGSSSSSQPVSSNTGNNNGSTDQPSNQNESNPAQDYVDVILKLMKENILTRYDLDWDVIEAEVNALAANAKTIPETYPAISKAAELTKTNHTFLVDANGNFVAGYNALDCTTEYDMTVPELDNIGYIRVDSFTSGDSDEQLAFASEIQQKIAAQDKAGLAGWIVDLRYNSGGNMWPMVAGLGPILGDGIHGYFIDPDESSAPWGYEAGAALANYRPIVELDEPYVLVEREPKVAVLSSIRVASSGEATLISFKKKSNVQIFGEASCGLSTVNRSYSLFDGSTLLLTVSTMADSEQQKYGGKVDVDQQVDPSAAVEAAVSWLNQ